MYAADYVLADYGTGAIMAVPGQDQRDWDFATKFDLPIVRTVQPPDGFEGEAFTGDGPAINSANDAVCLDGLEIDDAKRTIIAYLERARERPRRDQLSGCVTGCCRGSASGAAPIPIIHCPKCGEVAVPEDQLPVVLPELTGADLKPKGVSPLAAADDWVNVDCPHVRRSGEAGHRHDGHVRRLVVVLPALLLAARRRPRRSTRTVRRVDAGRPVRRRRRARHPAPAVRRFFTKALHDMGLVDFDEPFTALLNQGVVINQGKKMSKSLGNGVDLGEQLTDCTASTRSG